MKLLYAMKASGGSSREEGSLRDCHAGQYNFVSVREGLACQLKIGDMQTVDTEICKWARRMQRDGALWVARSLRCRGG